MTLRVRWLGRVGYHEALALQRALVASSDDHLLLLEHPPVYTLGVRADLGDVLVPASSVGAELVRSDRGGEVTYHGPGQLVAYPVLSVPGRRGGGMADTVAYVRSLEQLVIDALADLGLAGAGRDPRHRGVWVAGAKVCAVGVRLARSRSMHGFALNVDPDLAMFDHIVACGIRDRGVTSLAALGLEVTMAQVADAVVGRAVERWGGGDWERQDVAWPPEQPVDASAFSGGAASLDQGGHATATPVRLAVRLAGAGVGPGLDRSVRKPSWLRAEARLGPAYRGLERTVRGLELTTVCEEAGCPNIFECWAEGTATFMINGERCTRACGFCLVDTRHPEGPPDDDEPGRVAEAVERLGLDHAVVTAVARDDLADGGAGAFAATVAAVRRRVPGCTVEVLIPDCKGDADALDAVFAARPDVCNHNLETVARLQRAVRPSAGYARSLAVLARARAAGLVTKSGLIVGMGETDEEVVGALADLAGVGVDIVTVGQYLRPTARHLPVARWVEPATFERFRDVGLALGVGHVEASPLTRSSHHARQSLAAVTARHAAATG